MAESCTGGMVCSLFTETPGSSDVFNGGVVTYSNEAKHDILGVQIESLQQFGAVSEQVACEIAAGACKAFGTQLAASITGIAGPGGGTADKPVGTVHIACAAKGNITHKIFVFEGDRQSVRQQTTEAALDMLIDALAAL